MRDLIDRAEAQTELQFAAKRYVVSHEAHGEGQVVWSDNLISITDAMNALRNVPSAQPQRMRGRWVEVTNGTCIWKVCDQCGEKPLWNEWRTDRCESDFCPNCGADMRGEQDETD